MSKPLLSSGRHSWLLIIYGCSMIILTTLSILKEENFLHLSGKGIHYLTSKPLVSSGRHTWLLIISDNSVNILTALLKLFSKYKNSSTLEERYPLSYVKDPPLFRATYVTAHNLFLLWSNINSYLKFLLEERYPLSYVKAPPLFRATYMTAHNLFLLSILTFTLEERYRLSYVKAPLLFRATYMTAHNLPAFYINSFTKILLKVKNFLHLRGKVSTILCQSPSSLQGDVHDCS